MMRWPGRRGRVSLPPNSGFSVTCRRPGIRTVRTVTDRLLPPDLLKSEMPYPKAKPSDDPSRSARHMIRQHRLCVVKILGLIQNMVHAR